MNTPEPRSPRAQYRRTTTGLWFLTKPDDPNHPGEWVSDAITPLARVFIESFKEPGVLPLRVWGVEVEFSQPDGRARRTLIRRDDLHTAGRRVIATFARAGMRVAADRKGHERFLNYLARVQPPTLLRLGELTVVGGEDVLCLRAYDLLQKGREYEPQAYEFCDLYDGSRKLPQVLRILDEGDPI